jgi:hypothetical protein
MKMHNNLVKKRLEAVVYDFEKFLDSVGYFFIRVGEVGLGLKTSRTIYY